MPMGACNPMVRWCARFTPPGIATLNEESDAGLFKLLGVGRDFWLMDAQTEFADSTATSTAFDAVYPFFYSYFYLFFGGGTWFSVTSTTPHAPCDVTHLSR